MLELTLAEAKSMEKGIKKFITKSGAKIMTQKICEFLNNLGLELTDIGTGRSAYTYSGKVEIKEINSMKYLNGKFLVVGIANISNGKGALYRGYVARIKKEVLR